MPNKGRPRCFTPEEAKERKRASDREYQRKKRASVMGYKTQEYKKYREDNPLKVKAHWKLNAAIKNGKIKRSSCEVCGSSRNIQGHHEDYEYPLKIIWLCPEHHKQIHLINKKK